ncbi:hypothetical protein CALCODRAFT_455264 [Calocera cornea HHB12733]|uniref:GDP-fucose protein O-fucosyltransferase 2 n=1 Tax=Calocera cornea HHB12733 TaxID=1353952 RepID=A0A165EVV2_9BASI|nr:hypothetical protein CALCODRAFT_455264 [Calocera cornea HHB12733]
MKYVTTFATDGFTNQVYTYLSLLYFAWYTDRTAVLPAFVPGWHLPRSAGPLSFGQVFDLDLLRAQLTIEVIEWHDLKGIVPSVLLGTEAEWEKWETLGCWSAFSAAGRQHARSPVTTLLKLGMRIRKSLKADRYILDKARQYTDLTKLAHLGYPSERLFALSQNLTQPSDKNQVMLEPDDQFMCFDSLFYSTLDAVEHWSRDWDPVWNSVGRHLRWTPEIEVLAREQVNRVFGVPDNGPTPPYISVHLRRGDMSESCAAGEGTCMPNNDQVAAAIEEIQDQLVERGLHAPYVFVSSDETNPEWWAAIRERGWYYLDHEKEGTCERYGCWYTVLLDSAIHSLADGFVGTHKSTFSVCASRRVQSWAKGPVTFLRWSQSRVTVPSPADSEANDG